MKRKSGILLPIFSLPNDYGIGGFGKECYNFIDYLKSAGQSVWQVLPLVETGFGNSPYSSKCSYSFNPYFISLEHLKEDGLITDLELKAERVKNKVIDYGELYQNRYKTLRKAFLRFNKNDLLFKSFLRKGAYNDYAIFSALKNVYNCDFVNFPIEYKLRDEKALKKFVNANKEEYLFWQFLQFYAENEWIGVKEYAKCNGVKIIGDLPLYVAYDSVDVWVNPNLFDLNSDFTPKKVAGVPPDYFCEDGQLWGNPVYNYDEHKLDDFSWWKNRVKKAFKIYDYLRIDHFRGLDRFYAVEHGSENAKVGEWISVPSVELFNQVKKVSKKDGIIAEDLGVIDDGVRELLKKTGYPGMKVLSFAFGGDKDNPYLPENIQENSVCYTGTHDNDTLKGLVLSLNKEQLENMKKGVKNSLKLLKLKGEVSTFSKLIDGVIKLGAYSKSNVFILPFADVIKADSSKRINEPGKLSDQNWAIRFSEKDFSLSSAKKLKDLTVSSGRGI